MSLHLALVHFPTLDKLGQTVCTSVTNLDVHDFGRIATTYGAGKVWLVHPYEAQQKFLRRILHHWRSGWGSTYNPTRREALTTVELTDDLEQMAERIEATEGRRPVLIGTSARQNPHSLSYGALRKRLREEPDTPHCLVFGTGWGLHPDALEMMDWMLEPIKGPTPWNHLSVRAAAGIILDRLCGRE